MIHGKNLIVALDGVAVAAAKSCSLDMDRNFLEACSPVSGTTLTKIPTSYDWGVSVDGLIANNSSPTVNLQDLLIAGTKCLLTFTDGSGNRRAGFVYVKSCKEAGAVGNLATYSASFESTGPLYKYTQVNLYFAQGTDGCQLVADGANLGYDFQASSEDGVALADLHIPKKGYLYVPTSEVWAIFHSETANTISQAFDYADEQTLDRYYYKYNEGGVTMLPMDPDDMHTYNYVVACNEETTAIFLYE